MRPACQSEILEGSSSARNGQKKWIVQVNGLEKAYEKERKFSDA